MSQKPRLFIASSSERIETARILQEQLSDSATCVVWEHGVFRPSQHVLRELEVALDGSDFGVFILAPEDRTTIRENNFDVVRDNVLFEFGMFVGRLGIDRCFAVAQSNAQNFRIPSDLAGLVLVSAELDEKADAEAQLGPACHQIRRRIRALGAIPRNPGVMFSPRIQGVGDIKELISSARSEILAVGPTLAYIAQYLEKYLFQRASEGVVVKLLTMKRSNDFGRIVGKMTCGADFSDQLELCHRIFKRWCSQVAISGQSIQVRQTDIVPYSITIIDGAMPEGKLLLIPTPYGGSGVERPCLLIDKSTQPEAFLHYHNATTTWWGESEPIGFPE